MRFYKEIKSNGDWFVGCLVICLDDTKYFYVNRGKQVQSLQKTTFDIILQDLEPITQAQAVELVPAIVLFLADPTVAVPFPLGG